MSIIIDKEFQSLIPPLTPEELQQLEENCVKEGIRDALIVWKQPDGNDILIDGHNRWNISVKHGGIPFQIKRMEFPDRDAVKQWIILNQFGRRNGLKRTSSAQRPTGQPVAVSAHIRCMSLIC